jgi:hypothetical protein
MPHRMVQLLALSDLQLRSYGFDTSLCQQILQFFREPLPNKYVNSLSYVIFHVESNGANSSTIQLTVEKFRARYFSVSTNFTIFFCEPLPNKHVNR